MDHQKFCDWATMDSYHTPCNKGDNKIHQIKQAKMLIQTTSVTYSSASLGGLMLQNFGGFPKVTTWPVDIIEDLKRLVKQAQSPARLQNSEKNNVDGS